MARSVPIYDTQVTVAPGVFPLSTPHVDKSVHRGRVRPEVHGKTAPIGDLVKKVPNGTLSLESSTCPCNHVPVERGVSKPSSLDRKSVVTGKSVSVSVDLAGRRIMKKKKT